MANVKFQLDENSKAALKDLASTDVNIQNKAAVDVAVGLSELLLQVPRPNNTVRELFELKDASQRGSMKFPIAPNDSVAWKVAKIGTISRNWIEGDEVEIPVNQIATSSVFSLDYLEDADYDITEWVMNGILDAIIRVEEKEGWKLIRWAANSGAAATWGTGDFAPSVLGQQIEIPTSTLGTGKFSKTLISAMKLYFEDLGFTMKYLCGPSWMQHDIRGWTMTEIDYMTGRQIFEQGGLPAIWGTEIKIINKIREYLSIDDRKSGTATTTDLLIDSTDVLDSGANAWSGAQITKIDAGNLLACYGLAEGFGIMAIKTPLQIKARPELPGQEWAMGFSARERVGWATVDSKRVCMGIVDRTSSEP